MNNNRISYDWEEIDNVPLQIMKCGSWKKDVDEKSLFVIIPGNPGCMGFYKEFAEALFSKTEIPVWGISHTGHVSTPERFHSHPDVNECGLFPQIKHKIELLKRKIVPNVDKVYLIGHSIGCYIILHILDVMNEPKLHKGIMLFPTIERMACSPQGKWMTPLLVHGRWAIVMFAWVMTFVPAFVKERLVDYICRSRHLSTRETILHDILDPKVAEAATFMGMQEMQMVDARDDRIIKEQAEKIVFYYGATDHWCPVSYYNDMKKQFADVNMKLCSNGYRHAFVLRESEEVAEIVKEMLEDNFIFRNDY